MRIVIIFFEQTPFQTKAPLQGGPELLTEPTVQDEVDARFDCEEHDGYRSKYEGPVGGTKSCDARNCSVSDVRSLAYEENYNDRNEHDGDLKFFPLHHTPTALTDHHVPLKVLGGFANFQN